MSVFAATIRSLALCLLSASGAASAPVEFLPGTTRVICQVTGNYDTYLLKPTLSTTQTRASVIGTEVTVSWDLAGYHDPQLKVVVIDWLTESWGFLSVSQMRLIRGVD